MTRSIDIGVFGARGIPSTYGGYETFLTVLLPELVRRGHRVTIYCRKEDENSGSKEYEGVERVVLPAVKSKALNTLSHGVLAATRSRIARHEVVLSVNVANAFFTLLIKGSGQRVILNTDGQEWLRGKWGACAKAFFRTSAQNAGRGCAALVSDSNAMRRIYLEEFGTDSTVIPYCWTELDCRANREPLDAFGLRPNDYLLVAGRLNPENNIHRVVDAYSRSRVQVPLLVLGAANYSSPVERLVRKIADRTPGVIFGGHVPDRRWYAALVSQASAYIHGHSIGGINPSLLEAMGCGANILALSTSFNREALGKSGAYFSDFVTELPQLLENANTTDDNLRKIARSRVTELFNLSAVADAYEELILTVAVALALAPNRA